MEDQGTFPLFQFDGRRQPILDSSLHLLPNLFWNKDECFVRIPYPDIDFLLDWRTLVVESDKLRGLTVEGALELGLTQTATGDMGNTQHDEDAEGRCGREMVEILRCVEPPASYTQCPQ